MGLFRLRRNFAKRRSGSARDDTLGSGLISLRVVGWKMRAESMLLHGIFPPVTTPFYPDGNVYFKKLEHNVERYSKTPVAGLAVLGSTGQAIMLLGEEPRQVFTPGV